MFRFGLIIPAAAILAAAQTPVLDKWPAARAHVRLVGTVYYKFTSKLERVVELNFTLGNTHEPAKIVLRDALDRIAIEYGDSAHPAFAVRHISSSWNGSIRGEIPAFTLDDLMSGQVIVANNISYFGDPALGAQRQSAIREAVETGGRGYFANHASGDNNKTGWPWYTGTLHPWHFMGHPARVPLPVYKDSANGKHMVLQGVLAANTVDTVVPWGVDSAGNETMRAGVRTRDVMMETFRWSNDPSRDPAYRDKVRPLLKFDPRRLGADFAPEFRRKGGNLYAWLYRVGAGMTSYMMGGHENDEMVSKTGFDGGVGDFDRYLAQTLFYLAGYRKDPCDASCNGLSIVDDNEHVVPVFPGAARPGAGAAAPISFDPLRPAFTTAFTGSVDARLCDVFGRTIARKTGAGPARVVFDQEKQEPGIYFLNVRMGAGPAVTRRYVRLRPSDP